MLFGKKMVDYVHELFEENLNEGDSAVDATMGNGYDTLKLCECVGAKGRVYAFDIQKEALDRTRERLLNNHMEGRAELILASHDKIEDYVKEDIQAFVFNLGYLPKGDIKVITKTDTTILAIKQCLNRLSPGGIGAILTYWGHPGGEDEKNHVDKLLQMLPAKKYEVLRLENHNRAHTPPVLYMLKKR